MGGILGFPWVVTVVFEKCMLNKRHQYSSTNMYQRERAWQMERDLLRLEKFPSFSRDRQVGQYKSWTPRFISHSDDQGRMISLVQSHKVANKWLNWDLP